MQIFEPAIINGDNVNYTSISFLLELNELFFVLNIQIPADYPESQPVFQLSPVST